MYDFWIEKWKHILIFSVCFYEIKQRKLFLNVEQNMPLGIQARWTSMIGIPFLLITCFLFLYFHGWEVRGDDFNTWPWFITYMCQKVEKDAIVHMRTCFFFLLSLIAQVTYGNLFLSMPSTMYLFIHLDVKHLWDTNLQFHLEQQHISLMVKPKFSLFKGSRGMNEKI